MSDQPSSFPRRGGGLGNEEVRFFDWLNVFVENKDVGPF
jgi:hypothetical protein